MHVNSGESDSRVRGDPPWRFAPPPPPGLRLLAKPALSKRLGVGVHVGSYELLTEVRRRSSGPVYRAADRDLGTRVDVRFVRPRSSGGGVRPNEMHVLRDRLVEEARTWLGVVAPAVTEVLEVGVWQDYVYVASTAAYGVPLRRWLRQKPRVWAEIIGVFEPIAHGLADLHQRGLVHGDVTPDHIFVTADGRAVLGDCAFTFADGPRCHEDASPQKRLAAVLLPPPDVALRQTKRRAASAIERSALGSGAMVGTRGYRAPEANLTWLEPRSDQFSLCVCVYEALFGERPFEYTSVEHVEARLASAALFQRSSMGPVSAELVATLRRGLSPQPAARFDDMAALTAALVPPKRPRSSMSWLLVVVALGLVPWFLALAPTLSWGSASQCEADLQSQVPRPWNHAVAQRVAQRFATVRPRVPTAMLQALDGYADELDTLRAEACFDAYGPLRQSAGANALGCVEDGQRALSDLLEQLDDPQLQVNWRSSMLAVESLPAVRACITREAASLQHERQTLTQIEAVLNRAAHARNVGQRLDDASLVELEHAAQQLHGDWPEGTALAFRADNELGHALVYAGNLEQGARVFDRLHRVDPSRRLRLIVEARARTLLAAAYRHRSDQGAISWLIADTERRVTLFDAACAERPSVHEVALWLDARRNAGELEDAAADVARRLWACPRGELDRSRQPVIVAVATQLADWRGPEVARVWLQELDELRLLDAEARAVDDLALDLLRVRLWLAAGKVASAGDLLDRRLLHSGTESMRSAADRREVASWRAWIDMLAGDWAAVARRLDRFDVGEFPLDVASARLLVVAAELAYHDGDRNTLADAVGSLVEVEQVAALLPELVAWRVRHEYRLRGADAKTNYSSR